MACGEHDLVIVFSTATRPSGVREEEEPSPSMRDVIERKETSEDESENEKKIQFKRGGGSREGKGRASAKAGGGATSLLWPPGCKAGPGGILGTGKKPH